MFYNQMKMFGNVKLYELFWGIYFMCEIGNFFFVMQLGNI